MDIERFEHHVAHLASLIERGQLEHALIMAKKVRREATIITRALAAAIDANSQEAHSE